MEFWKLGAVCMYGKSFFPVCSNKGRTVWDNYTTFFYLWANIWNNPSFASAYMDS